jgi:hypothetical protein
MFRATVDPISAGQLELDGRADEIGLRSDGHNPA